MKKDEAIKILARHLMQCGALMPIEWVQKNGDGSEFMEAYEMAMDALKNEPVRCKDCEYWRVESGGLCKRLTALGVSHYRSANDFCSYGERRLPHD